MVKSLKKKKTVVIKSSLKTAHKKNTTSSRKPAIRETNAKENPTSSNLSHISLLSPIATTDRKNKTGIADKAASVTTINASWKMRDIVNPTENDVLMGRGGKSKFTVVKCFVFFCCGTLLSL